MYPLNSFAASIPHSSNATPTCRSLTCFSHWLWHLQPFLDKQIQLQVNRRYQKGLRIEHSTKMDHKKLESTWSRVVDGQDGTIGQDGQETDLRNLTKLFGCPQRVSGGGGGDPVGWGNRNEAYNSAIHSRRIHSKKDGMNKSLSANLVSWSYVTRRLQPPYRRYDVPIWPNHLPAKPVCRMSDYYCWVASTTTTHLHSVKSFVKWKKGCNEENRYIIIIYKRNLCKCYYI